MHGMKTSLKRPALVAAACVVCASSCAMQTCMAFVARPSPMKLTPQQVSLKQQQQYYKPEDSAGFASLHTTRRQALSGVRKASTTTARAMSTIPGDGEGSNEQTLFKKPKLPPLPENTLILGGDVAWLFFYSFLDHTLHDLFVKTTASVEPDIVGIHAAWIDMVNKPAEFMAASSEYGMSQPYSPALDSPGICAVLFATLWLVNGYFQQSFSYQNTVSCESHTAVQVAAKTWAGAALGMLVLAYTSDAMSLAGLQHQVGGLTQTDLDFILSSLPVMVCWRWMIAYIFNGWFK
jgi:hypothetical protein